MWDKTDVENLIYAQAARENQEVWACEGCLLCTGGSAFLAELLRIYNRFFAAENRRFLAREIQQDKRTVCAAYQAFLAERKLKPVRCAIGFLMRKTV